MNASHDHRPNVQELWQKLLRVLSLTRERELTCTEVEDFIDYYVELELAGEEPQKILPEVAQHLRICPECREEHEALRKMLDIDLAT